MTVAPTSQDYIDAGYLLDDSGLICGRSENHPRGAISFTDPPTVTPTSCRLPRSAKVLPGRKKAKRTIGS